jgi:hypothetical protein
VGISFLGNSQHRLVPLVRRIVADIGAFVGVLRGGKHHITRYEHPRSASGPLAIAWATLSQDHSHHTCCSKSMPQGGYLISNSLKNGVGRSCQCGEQVCEVAKPRVAPMTFGDLIIGQSKSKKHRNKFNVSLGKSRAII